MKVHPYLNFSGDCEAAFRFYERTLGGELGEIFRYGGSPMAEHAPADWADKVMHASVTLGGQLVQGADVIPSQYEPAQGFSMSIQLSDPAEAERVFEEMSAGGSDVMPLQKTFWAERFGMLVDRFGIRWLINCEAVGQPEGV